MPCKLVGCAGFGGLGLYSFYQAQQLPKNLVARRLGLGAMGTGTYCCSFDEKYYELVAFFDQHFLQLTFRLLAFIGAAIYRLTMPIPPQQPASEQ